MRAYTLSILAKLTENNRPIADAEVIEWANSKVYCRFFAPAFSLDPLPLTKHCDRTDFPRITQLVTDNRPLYCYPCLLFDICGRQMTVR